MVRRIGVLCLLAALTALLALPASAQGDWFALLYNNMTREFLRVNADGTEETYSLGLPENLYVNARDMAFSPDGSHVAFCVIEYKENNQNITTLFVRELATESNVLTQDLGSSIGCRVTGNDDLSLLAVALVRYYTGAPQTDPSLFPWELSILDADTGEIVNSLTPESPLAPSLEYAYGETFLPFVLQFARDEVIFGEVPYGSEFPPDFPTYSWQLDANTLEPTAGWGYPFSDTLESTGELASLAQDPTLPAGEPGGPLPRNNIVTVTDASGATEVVCHSPDWILVGVEFIDNGERLAFELLEPFDPNDPNVPSGMRLIALDRPGNVTELISSGGSIVVMGAPDGFVVFVNQSSTLPSMLSLQYGSDGNLNTVWSYDVPQTGSPWELAFVIPPTPAENLPPFKAINP
jgi:hypothetical protein